MVLDQGITFEMPLYCIDIWFSATVPVLATSNFATQDKQLVVPGNSDPRWRHLARKETEGVLSLNSDLSCNRCQSEKQ